MKLEFHHHYHVEHDALVLAKLERIEAHLKVIQQGQVKLMSQIDDFAAKVNAAFDALDTAHDGLAADVASLKDDIAKLQAGVGVLSADDQAKLQAVTDRAQKISDGFAALDALTTPPAAPAP